MEEKNRIGTQPKGIRFAKWLGILKINVAGDEYEIRPTMGHKQKLLSIQTRSKDGKLTEADWKEQHDIFKDILRISYPDEENFDNFLLENDLEFMMALFIGFGWATEDSLKDLKSKSSNPLQTIRS